MGILHKLFEQFDKFSQNKITGQAITAIAVAFFSIFVLAPLFFVFLQLGNFKFLPEMREALAVSFIIAILATAFDLLFGIPVAWLLTKKKFPFRDALDAVIDLPLVVPTSALGLSIALFWGAGGLSMIVPGLALIILLHIAFTFPYVVRTTQAAIMAIDDDMGRAASTLGASPLLSFRTIWLQLFKSGAISGAILAFTRSLGETGATIIVAGAVQTVPVLTVFYKNSTPPDMNAAISLSMILILISAAIFLVMRRWTGKSHYSFSRVYVEAEKRLSKYSMHGCAIGLLAFFAIVLLPSIYFLKFTDFDFFTPQTISAISISFGVGISATLITLLFGIPFSLYIASSQRGSSIFKLFNDLALLVPTVTIGISLSLFWAGRLPEMDLLVLTSVAVIFPYFAGTVSEIASNLDRSLIEVARSLGARPFYAFRTVLFPLLLPTLVAGTLIAFMRSVAETGSTLAVSKTIVTIPILIVNLSKAGQNAQAASAAALLLAISVIIVFALRSTQKRKW
ncbi:MAG: ABC transporter permease subunit [Candidatus Micrarchaeota archaeon]|nr:ABC transporter permease subunit [Candidatus Micrarchaeota archaeon]